MNIAFDAKRYYHNHTGLGNYSRTLVQNLQQFFPENEYTLLDEGAWNRTLRLGSKAAEAGATVLHGLSNELSFDIDHRKASPVRGLVTLHDVAWRTFPAMYHRADRLIYDWKYGSSCRRAHQIVCISENTRRDVLRYYGVAEERVAVVYPAMLSLFYQPMSEAEAHQMLGDQPDYILYVGSLNSRKNLMSVLEALTLMPAENRPRLIVVGNGREYRRRVEAFIADHALSPYVDIRDDVRDNHVLQALYRQAKAFVFPSFYEGFGLPLVESALQHTPVITSRVSSLPEAAGPDACYIDPHSKDAAHHLVCHLDKLLGDSAYRNDLADRQEAYARQTFDPRMLTEKMMDLYRSLAQ
ncbi:MAG: glycosyltransferase family 4 protein [Bacteroidaceae bacterium]|nr:glycosyltransferase family 4 protein [Bacteroidaceae bacterium]